MHSVRFCKSSSCWDWSTSEEQLNENKKQIQIDHSHRLETIDIIHYWAWSLTVQYSLWFLLNFLFKAEYDRVDVPSDGLTCVHGCCCWTIPRNKTELDRNPKHSIFKRATDATNKKMFEIPLGLVIKKTTIVSSPSYICITAILDKLESHYPCDCKFLSGTLNILWEVDFSRCQLHPLTTDFEASKPSQNTCQLFELVSSFKLSCFFLDIKHDFWWYDSHQ